MVVLVTMMMMMMTMVGIVLNGGESGDVLSLFIVVDCGDEVFVVVVADDDGEGEGLN